MKRFWEHIYFYSWFIPFAIIAIIFVIITSPMSLKQYFTEELYSVVKPPNSHYGMKKDEMISVIGRYFLYFGIIYLIVGITIGILIGIMI
jgi:hypothetical protein